MKGISSFALLLLLPGCSNSSAFKHLEQKHWSTTIAACGNNYLTFDGGQIAAHPNGTLLPVWDIKSVGNGWWWRSSDISIQVEPSANIMPFIIASGKYKPGLHLNLHVEDNSVSISSTSLGSETKPVKPGDGMFNLVACPQQ